MIETEYQPSQEPPRPVRQAPPPQRRQQPSGRSGGNGLSRLTLAVSVLALILAGAALFLTLKPEPEPEEPPDVSEEEPVTFRFGDRIMTPLEGMPLNPYDRAGFSLDEKGRVTYERDGIQAKTGVDVSTYQQEIDWEAVADDGIDFAILRLGYRGYGSEGTINLDSCFQKNLAGARAAGIKIGVYFFSQAITTAEAEEEARFVLENLNGAYLEYPVVYDWEVISASGARTAGLSNTTLTDCAVTFCQSVAMAGYTPMIYYNLPVGYTHYQLDRLVGYDVWFAQYASTPSMYYNYRIWQYSDKGSVPGIEGNVDMDLAFIPY